MNIIDLARQIGVAIQNDETYIRFRAAEQIVESDDKLQELIGEFNMLKMSINNEVTKNEQNSEKIAGLNEKCKAAYEQIMQNENMVKYNEEKKQLDSILVRVNTIIMKSVQGEDPMTADYNSQCGGSCETCGGCH